MILMKENRNGRDRRTSHLIGAHVRKSGGDQDIKDAQNESLEEDGE